MNPTYAPDIWQRFGGKKFCLTVFLVLCAVAAVVFDIDVDADILKFLEWLVGLYMAGNVGKSWLKPAAPVSVPDPAVKTP